MQGPNVAPAEVVPLNLRRVSTPIGPTRTRGNTLEEVTDLDLLRSIGYDPGEQFIWFASDHKGLVGVTCTGCGASRLFETVSGTLCTGCTAAWKRDGKPNMETFRHEGHGSDTSTPALCRVCCLPGHERPAVPAGDLCQTHSRTKHGVDLVPLREFGECAVESCDRIAAGTLHRVAFCEFHNRRLSGIARLQGEGFSDTEVSDFCRTDPSAERVQELRRPHVDLSGLAPVARAQVLAILSLGLKKRLRSTPQTAARLAKTMDACGVLDVFDVVDWQPLLSDTFRRNGAYANAVKAIRSHIDALRLATTSPDDEMAKDSWNLAVFGYPRGDRIHFAGGPGPASDKVGQPMPPIRPEWLKAAAKARARELVASRKGKTALINLVRACAEFGKTLALREDGGDDITRLGRADIERHLIRLNKAEDAGELGNQVHAQAVVHLRKFLAVAESNRLVWKGPGGVLEGLPDTFRFVEGDHVRQTKIVAADETEGKSVPLKVMRQLLSAEGLDALRRAALHDGERGVRQAAGKAMGPDDAVAAVLIHAETGRRTQELVSLRWDCLEAREHVTPDGRTTTNWFVIYDANKVGKRRVPLPISAATARVIKEQQKRVDLRYPTTPTAKLALFPKHQQNPHGTESTTDGWFSTLVREWMTELGTIEGVDVDLDGQPLPYPLDTITPYSFRHTYAQRHADGGTPPEVLQEIMGHQNLETTQTYYQVSRKRQIEAVRALAPLQIDFKGVHSGLTSPEVDDAAASLYVLGGLAVPYGNCTEPNNNRAGGKACAFRHLCLGCGFFRTDPSHLPDLRYALERHLTDRTEVRIALDAGMLEPWTAEIAMPHDMEVAKLRLLVERCEAQLTSLDSATRTALEDRLDTITEARAFILATLPAEMLIGADVHAPERPTVIEVAPDNVTGGA